MESRNSNTAPLGWLGLTGDWRGANDLLDLKGKRGSNNHGEGPIAILLDEALKLDVSIDEQVEMARSGAKVFVLILRLREPSEIIAVESALLPALEHGPVESNGEPGLHDKDDARVGVKSWLRRGPRKQGR